MLKGSILCFSSFFVSSSTILVFNVISWLNSWLLIKYLTNKFLCFLSHFHFKLFNLLLRYSFIFEFVLLSLILIFKSLFKTASLSLKITSLKVSIWEFK
ncbi:hypothetical protein NW072_05665 [Mycoplasmopsis felis]|uniref:hypothetical protein n=1 Tax=Mycoplasmopsis felis TaxID=33923 RepID=UPI0021AE71E0|nr:hypothetical protein [Mycoplasmopsis felis]UWV79476.1 hypothetical protein NW072_05665 [Mycoplasmopsis felis]